MNTVYRQQTQAPALIKNWGTPDGHKFTLLAAYNPNEEDDTWVEYQNNVTGQTYTCRMEAFVNRFHPLPD